MKFILQAVFMINGAIVSGNDLPGYEDRTYMSMRQCQKMRAHNYRNMRSRYAFKITCRPALSGEIGERI